MRLVLFVCFVFSASFVSFAFIPAVRAQGDWTPPKSASTAPPDRVQLVEDDENGKLRIVIDGKELGWFDATGLYVAGNIAYTGTITDGLPSPVSGEEASDAPQ